MLILLSGLLTTSPVLADTPAPSPGPGWGVEKLLETEMASSFRFANGLLAVPKEVTGSRGAGFSWDIYRLGLGPGDPPVAGVLRDVVTGWSISLDENLVAFTAPKPGTDPDVGSADIYVLELSGGEPRLLSRKSPEVVLGAQVDGNHVLWWQWGFHHQAEVMLYDHSTGLTTNISANPDSNGNPDIDGDDVVWQLWNGAFHWIFHYRISTGKTEELARGIRWTANLSPQVEDGRAIWVTHEWLTPQEDRSSLFLRNLAEGRNQLITTSGGGLWAVLSGDLLLISKSEDGERFELSVRNLLTGSARLVGDSATNPELIPFASPDQTDNTILYGLAEPLASGEGFHSTIYIYDGATDQTTEVVEGDNIGLSQLDRGRVVFIQGSSPDTSPAATLWLAIKDDAPSYGRYLDVPRGHTFHDEILGLSDRGIVEGYGMFPFLAYKPSLPVLRAQYAKMLVTALGLHDDVWTNWDHPTFKDVPQPAGLSEPDRYPFDYVEEAAEAGLIQGFSTDIFAPWQEITRAQLALMIARAGKGRLITPAAPAPFTDILGLSVEARDAIAFCYANGIVSGKTDTTFDPGAKATRGQAAKMTWGLLRALD